MHRANAQARPGRRMTVGAGSPDNSARRGAGHSEACGVGLKRDRFAIGAVLGQKDPDRPLLRVDQPVDALAGAFGDGA